MNSYVSTLSNSNYIPNPDDNLMDSLFKQYERVIVESLITSFGLDFLIKDQHGGDVDTIHNVRTIGDGINSDSKMTYKNEANKIAHQNREPYDRADYHEKNGNYKTIREQAKTAFNEQGQWIDDAYTGSKIGINKALPNEKRAELDHVLSAKSIHDDRGRTLAGVSGADLANNPDNLRFTNMKLNNNMRDKDIPDYINWCEQNPDKVNWNGIRGEPLPDNVKNNLMKEYERSKKALDAQINHDYYTSSRFLKDSTRAAGIKGIQMGIRQAVGLIFTEIWFSVEEEFHDISMPFQLGQFLIAVGNGIKKGFNNAKNKYAELLSRFKEGVLSGVLSSLTTTLCNIFFTTAKNIVKVIRQSYVSLVQATEILFLNPDNLPFGERMKATSKIIATGASVVLGSIVSEAIADIGIKIPILCEIIPSFCGALVTGILTCSLLYYLDHSPTIKKLVSVLNKIPSLSAEVDFYRRQAVYFEHYAAELMEIDLEKFKNEAAMYTTLVQDLESAKDSISLNHSLKNAFKTLGIEIPWKEDFNSFMNDKSQTLVFE